jgi:hypothetical protein
MSAIMTCADSFKSILKKEKDFSYETDSSSSYSTVHSCGGLSPNVVAVLGCQWGDEAKGKLVGLMCPYADVCCRFNGMILICIKFEWYMTTFIVFS